MTCDDKILSAYVDDELDSPARERVERHLRQCSRCAELLVAIHDTSQFMDSMEPSDITPLELARVHRGIDEIAQESVFRFGGVVGLIAASILAICAVWLAALPQRPSMPSLAAARVESWEEVATTLRVNPLPDFTDNNEPIRLADTSIANWMINSLNASQP